MQQNVKNNNEVWDKILKNNWVFDTLKEIKYIQTWSKGSDRDLEI